MIWGNEESGIQILPPSLTETQKYLAFPNLEFDLWIAINDNDLSCIHKDELEDAASGLMNRRWASRCRAFVDGR